MNFVWTETRRRGTAVMCCLAVVFFAAKLLANDEPPPSPGGMGPEIEKFCEEREISDKAVHIALAHLWQATIESQGDFGLPTSSNQPQGAPRSVPTEVYWQGWRGGLHSYDLHIRAGPSLVSRSVKHTTVLRHGSIYDAGDRRARSLIRAALAESRIVEQKSKNAPVRVKEFLTQLPHYQAVRLLQHMVKCQQQQADSAQAGETLGESPQGKNK